MRTKLRLKGKNKINKAKNKQNDIQKTPTTSYFLCQGYINKSSDVFPCSLQQCIHSTSTQAHSPLSTVYQSPCSLIVLIPECWNHLQGQDQALFIFFVQKFEQHNLVLKMLLSLYIGGQMLTCHFCCIRILLLAHLCYGRSSICN